MHLVSWPAATGDAASTMSAAASTSAEPSGCPASDGPQFGPHYWGIKEADAAFGELREESRTVPLRERHYLEQVPRAATAPKLPP